MHHQTEFSFPILRSPISPSDRRVRPRLLRILEPLLRAQHRIVFPPVLANLGKFLVEEAVPRLSVPGARSVWPEEDLDLLEGLPGGLGVGEEGLDGGAEAEGAEDDEELPGDAGEGGGDEESDCEVEEPGR